MSYFFYYILLFSFLYNTNLIYRFDNNIKNVKYYHLKTLSSKLNINITKFNIDNNNILLFLSYIVISYFA